jgi:hypothetical protein
MQTFHPEISAQASVRVIKPGFYLFSESRVRNTPAKLDLLQPVDTDSQSKASAF